MRISAVGAASSLGPGWRGACAAAYAGLTRTAEVGFHVLTEDTNEEEDVTAHALPTGAAGFEGRGRLLRLAELALADLRRSVDLEALPRARTGLVVVLPDAARSRTAMGIEGVDEGGVFDNPFVGPDEPHRTPQEWQGDFQRLTGLGVGAADFVCVVGGDTSVLDAVHHAAARLASGAWSACLLVAADSLLEPGTLQWLAAHRRLKCEANPLGLRPGEAGVCLLLEPVGGPSVTGGEPLATVEGVALAVEEHTQRAGATSTGLGLGSAVAQLGEATGRTGSMGWVISDMNGELYGGNELGHAHIRARRSDPSFGTAGSVYPAASFGDTGVASGALALVLGIAGLERHRIPGDRVVILSTDLDGRRAAALLAHPRARA